MCQRRLRNLRYRQLTPVPPDQRYKLRCRQVPRKKPSRRRKAAKQPSQVKPVCPVRNADLIAAQERDCRTDAMNCWKVIEVLLEVVPQSLLRSATQRDNHVFRSKRLESPDQFRILDLRSVHGRLVNALFRDTDSLGSQPPDVRLRTAPARHYPECTPGLAHDRMLQ